MIQKKINSIVFLLLPLQVPKSRQCSAALQKCNSSLNSSSFQMSPTRSSTIFPFKHTYSTIPRGHSTTTTYLCSLCIKVCFIGQKEFSQRLATLCFPAYTNKVTQGFRLFVAVNTQNTAHESISTHCWCSYRRFADFSIKPPSC